MIPPALSLSIVLLVCGLVKCFEDEFPSQPKILSLGGDIILQAVPDKNITFRIKRPATLMVNDIDVIDKIQQYLAVEQSAEPPLSEPLSSEALTEQVTALKGDIGSLTKRLAGIQRRTRGRNVRNRFFNRCLARISRLSLKVAAITTNLAIDECRTEPCKNGGTCYDGYKSYQCECAAGWEGVTCEDDVNECQTFAGTDLAGCMNNAECVNTPGSFRCVCRNGFTGTHCRLRKAVCITSDSTELCGHGTCIPANNPQGYVCFCDQGWTKQNETAACTVDVDECEPTKNPCHSDCINLPGSFKCGACPKGYTGDGKYCRDIDECATNNGGCSLQPKVRCINTEGSHLCGRCPIGWTGDGRSCEQTGSKSCNDLKICHPRASCEFISDTTVCTCPLGMYGHGFGEDGCTVDVSFDLCERHKCANNGTCIVNGRGTSCICQQGYMGPMCNETDACHGNPCQNGASCHLLPENKYKCNCLRGYTGANCEHLRFFCGSSILNETGSLRFPPSGALYEPDERCAFILLTAQTKVLNVTFTAFDLEASTDCSKDFLQIHDGNSLTTPMIGRFCGQTLPKGDGNVISTNKHLFFWFRSDNATQASGFNMSWVSQPHICGDRLVLEESDSGVIRSPGYPGKISNNRDCQWTLEVPFGYRLLLHFYEITLGANKEDCTGDTFIIKDSDRILLRSCASEQPPPLHSSSNQLSISLHTDAYRSDSAFQLHYEVVAGTPGCGGVYTEPRGTIAGYMNAPVCLYLIQQPNDTKIELQFTKFELLNSRDCSLQRIEVFDGRTTEAPLLTRLCGKQDIVDLSSIASTGNVLLLRYEYALHGLTLAKTFEFNYMRTCGGEYNDIDGGVITTPGYPNAYYEHMTCTYVIRAPLNYVVQMNITDLSISQTVPNMADDDLDENAGAITSINDERNYLDVHISDVKVEHYFKESSNIVTLSQSNQAKLVFHGASNRERKRGLRVEYTFKEMGCGGVISGRFHGLRVVSNFCEWFIYEPAARGITLSVTMYSENDQATLSIYDGDKELHRYHKDERMESKDYFVNRLRIVYRGNRWDFTLLTMHYVVIDDDTCGGAYSSSIGYIKSPNWPKPYGPSKDCIWLIRAPLGHKIELTVQNFTLETTNTNCEDDYLEIRNGDTILSPLIGKYCGTQIPLRIPSFGNHLYVAFHSDSYLQEAGFHITWQQTKTGCGGKLTSHIGSIHSPHSATTQMYGAVSCDWQIYVSQGSTVNLNLSSIGANLCNGPLIFYDGPNTQSRQLSLNCTEHLLNQQLFSTGNKVLVRYIVQDDEVGAALPFVIDYETNCNVVLDKPQGVLETPNFPAEYPPNMNCVWDIRSSGRNNHISLVFSHLTVESLAPTNCDYDYVELSDMRNEEVLSKRRLCTSTTDPIISEGNRQMVRFVSDASGHAKGFHAEYKRLGCGEHFYERLGRFESPQKPYSVDMECDWYIEAPFGKQIRLNLEELHIETEQRDCSSDALLVAEEKSSTVPLLKSCQVAQSNQILTSPANRLYVNYRASNTRSRKYFKAFYSFVDATCGGIQQTTGGLIVSPNYHTGEFATNMECLWSVEVPDGYGIELHFETFNLTESENCSKSSIELYKRSGQDELFLEKACGNEQPLIKRVEGNQMIVKFKTTSSGYGRFALRFEQQCGGALYTTEGLIKSRLDENCIWVLNGSPDSKISVDILHLECPCAVNTTCQSSLKLFNEETDVLLFDVCRDHRSNMIMPTNRVKVVATNIDVRLRYSNMQNSCGGNITSLRGILTSPFYPDVYPSNVECVWELRATSGNAFELNFELLEIVKSTSCNTDFLEVRQGCAQGKLIGLYCSDVRPLEPLFATDHVWLKFRSVQESIGGRGFKLRWNYVHEHEINATNGIIESPPVQIARFEEEPYSWRILVQRGDVVELNFKEYNDGLKLYDGYDDTALAIEIKYSPWRFSSSSNVLYLRSENEDLETFKIEWRAKSSTAATTNETNSDCHQQFKLSYDKRQKITSPGYPNGYAPDLKCVWTLEPAEPTQHVVVDLYEVKLETSPDCWTDSLVISTSSNLYEWHDEKKVCDSPNATIVPFDSIHGTPFAKLTFTTDASINGTGFRATAYTVCGGNLTAPIGVIFDSHIERSRILNKTCLWYIEVRPGKQIDITIDYNGETLKEHENCPHYGLIYDGLDEHSPLIQPGKFCNQQGFKANTFRSKSNHVVVKYFLPNLFGNPPRNLWNLTYREYSECDEEIQLTAYASSVNISTPGYPYVPHPHTECFWTIIAPPGETITANFVDQFDMNTRYCSQEFVELYDGSTTMARRLLRSCRKPPMTRSSGNLLYVRYRTDIDEPRSGFRLNVTISTCGGVFTDSDNVITSEHYPALGAYPKPAICEYSIKLSKNIHARINFTDLHLPYDTNNGDNNDRLELFDLKTMSRTMIFYGNVTTPPSIFETESNELLLRFTSVNLNNTFRGFSLRYQRIYDVCFRSMESPSGVITNIPRDTRSSYTVCRWRITVPKGQLVRLRFLELQPASIVNRTDRIISSLSPHYRQFLVSTPTFSFYNDDQSVSKITEFDLSNYNASMVIRSTDNFMLVKISLGRSSTMGRVKAEYTSEEDSPCPSDIGATESGLIDVSRLENLESFHCTVLFTTKRQETISFNIAQYTTLKKYATGAISFRDQELLIPFLNMDQNITNGRVSLSPQRGKIIIMQDKNIKLLAFQVSYRRHPCGGKLKLEDGLTLVDPSIDQTSYGQLECVWTLVRSYGDNDYALLGNVTFTDSCDREYIWLYFGIRAYALEPIKLCRDTPQLNNILLKKTYTTVVYHTENYKPQQDSFILMATNTINGSVTNVGIRPTNLFAIDAKHYKNNMNIYWEFTTNPSLTLSLIFKGHFFIEDSHNCINDSMEIQRRQNDLWYTDARFCGRVVPPSYNISTHQMRVVFRTNEAITGDGFGFVVVATCDARLNATSELQVLNSPKHDSYRGRGYCTYVFESNTDKLITVNLKYTSPLYMSLSSRKCELSSFNVYKQNEDDKEVLVNKYCENFEISGYRRLRIDYDSLITRNFIIEYRLNDCGGNFSTPFDLRPLKGVETNTYASNMNCIWHITAPVDHAIIVRFKYLDMEKNFECIPDSVSIYKGAVQSLEQRIAHLCGNMTVTPPVVVIDSNQAVIVAVSDSTLEREGFLASVHFTPNCNERITLTEGNSQMSLHRSFTVNRSEELLCFFKISALAGYRIAVDIKDLQLNNSIGLCATSKSLTATCNSLEIIEGQFAGSTSMGKYFSVMGRSDSRLVSSYEELIIKLNANKPGNISFELNLQMESTACNRAEYDFRVQESFNITLERNLSTNSPNMDCSWTFMATDNSVEIDFVKIQLPPPSQVTGKCEAYIKVSNLYYNRYFCGIFNNTQILVPHYVSNDKLQISFHSDNPVEQVGDFELIVSSKISCNRNYSSLSQYISIQSRKSESKCIYNVHVSESYTLTLYIMSIYLASSPNSSFNVIDVNSNQTLYNITKNKFESKSLFTSTNNLRIYVEGAVTSSLFYMSTNKSLPRGCGGEIFALEGMISNPSYEGHNGSECRWNVEVPGYEIFVGIYSFNMGSLSNCHLDNVKIYEVRADNTEKLINTFCGDNYIEPFTVHSNRMTVVATKSPNFDGEGFKINFSSPSATDLPTSKAHHEFV